MFGRKNKSEPSGTGAATALGLGEMLEEITRRYKRREALVFENKSYTYQELDENANRVASGLQALGINPGDRVAMMLPNIPEFAFSFFGIQKLGAVAVPFNTMYKGREISFILKDSGARAIICLTNFANLINEIKEDCPELEHVIVTGQRTLVFLDPEPLFKVLWVPAEIKDKAVEPTTSVESESGSTMSLDRFRDVLIAEFTKVMGVTFETGELTRDEQLAYEKNRALAGRI